MKDLINTAANINFKLLTGNRTLGNSVASDFMGLGPSLNYYICACWCYV